MHFSVVLDTVLPHAVSIHITYSTQQYVYSVVIVQPVL